MATAADVLKPQEKDDPCVKFHVPTLLEMNLMPCSSSRRGRYRMLFCMSGGGRRGRYRMLFCMSGGGRRGRYRMGVGFTTTWTISAFHY